MHPCAALDAQSGFTLIEVLIVVVIMGALATLALPNFQRVVERDRVARAIGDIKAIQQNITEYYLLNNAYPNTLAAVEAAAILDPWGRAYEYLPVAGGGKGKKGKGKGGFRKDRFLVPINSDYDLYSKGPDGASQAPLTAKASKDDIIRANDG